MKTCAVGLQFPSIAAELASSYGPSGRGLGVTGNPRPWRRNMEFASNRAVRPLPLANG